MAKQPNNNDKSAEVSGPPIPAKVEIEPLAAGVGPTTEQEFPTQEDETD